MKLHNLTITSDHQGGPIQVQSFPQSRLTMVMSPEAGAAAHGSLRVVITMQG